MAVVVVGGGGGGVFSEYTCLTLGLLRNVVYYISIRLFYFLLYAYTTWEKVDQF